jgi:hypothetical protein
MLLLSLGGEPPYHQAFLADAERIVELKAALEPLRRARDAAAIAAFFERYEAEYLAAERAIPLEVSKRKWKARWLEVRDFLKSEMMPAHSYVREDDERVTVRKLGWVRLDRELGRARALQRIGAPDVVLRGQRERVRAAYVATGWKGDPKPSARPPAVDSEFWSLPVRVEPGSSEISIGGMDAHESEQQSWGNAQEIVERGIALCVPPLTEPVGLGGHASLDAPGEELIDSSHPAHAGWVQPTWRPYFRIGRAALGLEAAVMPRSGSEPRDVEHARERLARAVEAAAEGGRALVWWLDPSF